MPQSPAADSGAVAVPSTVTPLIVATDLAGPLVARAANTGADVGVIEVAFSWSGAPADFVVWPTTAFGGSAGAGIPAGATVDVPLPMNRPPFIRVRGNALTTNTILRVQLYELVLRRGMSSGAFAPYVP